MSKDLLAEASTSIHASKRQVWDALVTPDAIKQYMFGANVESDWTEGSEITWTGEMDGKPYKDSGLILEVIPERTLTYIHLSPKSAEPNAPEDCHTVTIHLSGVGIGTHVALSQDNNADEKARKESETNWEIMLEGLKQFVENGSKAAL
jgi:uncharacterized protein YndB with AHSA1/START domain